MISRDTFIETMYALESLDDKMNKVEDAMEELCSGFSGFYIQEVFDIVMNMLIEMFKDENDWLEYFVSELDFMHDYKHGYVFDENQQPIEINGWGGVYDFLIKKMED